MNRSTAIVLLGLVGLFLLVALFSFQGGLTALLADVKAGKLPQGTNSRVGAVILFLGLGAVVLLLIADQSPQTAYVILALLYVAFIMSHLGPLTGYAQDLADYFNARGVAPVKTATQAPPSGIYTAHQ